MTPPDSYGATYSNVPVTATSVTKYAKLLVSIDDFQAIFQEWAVGLHQLLSTEIHY